MLGLGRRALGLLSKFLISCVKVKAAPWSSPEVAVVLHLQLAHHLPRYMGFSTGFVSLVSSLVFIARSVVHLRG